MNAWKNPNAITVVFDRPDITICRKYQLASEEDISHILCIPGIRYEWVDEFIKDLRESMAELGRAGMAEPIAAFA
jgi:histidine decarboxylase